MMGHKICFIEKYRLLSLNYACYPFLSGAQKWRKMYQTNTIIKIISDQKILFRFHIRVFFLIRPGGGFHEEVCHKGCFPL